MCATFSVFVFVVTGVREGHRAGGGKEGGMRTDTAPSTQEWEELGQLITHSLSLLYRSEQNRNLWGMSVHLTLNIAAYSSPNVAVPPKQRP